jgi:DNA repair protein RadC
MIFCKTFIVINLRVKTILTKTRMENTPVHLQIKSWAEADRPREKMLLQGRIALTDAELVAILLGSGSRNETAVQLAQRILASVSNNLHELGKRTLPELQKFKGIGEAKAITIAAALEIGRRRQATAPEDRPQIRCARDSFSQFLPVMADLPHEEFWILFLNQKNSVIHRERISAGGITGTVVDTRLVFRRAIEVGAVQMVLGHNHPSGNLEPSAADMTLTRNLVEAGKVLEIKVLDHIIVSEKGFYSFAEEGNI